MVNETPVSPGEKGYEYKDRVVNSSGDKKFIIKSEVNDENGKYLIGDLIPNDTTQEGTKINADLFNNLEGRLSTIEEGLETKANQEDVDSQIEGINTNLNDKASQEYVDSQIGGITSQIEGITIQTGGITSQIEGITSQIDQLQSEIGQLKEDVENHVGLTSNHETRISTLEDSDLSSVNSLQRSVNDFNNRLNSVESRMYTLEANCSGSNGGIGGFGTLTQDQFDFMLTYNSGYMSLTNEVSSMRQIVSEDYPYHKYENNRDIGDIRTVSTNNTQAIETLQNDVNNTYYQLCEVRNAVSNWSNVLSEFEEGLGTIANYENDIAEIEEKIRLLEIGLSTPIESPRNFVEAYATQLDFEGKTVRFISQNYNAGGMFEIRFTDGSKVCGSGACGMGFSIHEYSGTITPINDGYYSTGYFETPITYEWDTDCHETIVESFWIDMSCTGNEFVQVTPQEFNDNISIEFEIVENQ